MLVLSGSSLYAYIIATVFGVYMGISETVQRAIIPQYVNQELRGTAFGLFNLIVGSSYFIGNIVFGLLWDSKGLFYSLTYSIITTIAAIIMMSIFIKKCSAQAHNQL